MRASNKILFNLENIALLNIKTNLQKNYSIIKAIIESVL